MTAGIDRRSGVAMWRQIADEIRASIARGEFAVAAPLPSEMALADRFGVNRHTVRSAIASLVQEGILRAERGRGTFVEKREQLQFAIRKRTRFSEGLSRQGTSGEGRVLATGRSAADQETAAALRVAPGADLVRVDMLYVVEGAPVSIATNFFDAARFTGIGEAVADSGSITAALARCGIADYTRCQTTITARHADGEDLSALRLSPGAIVLYVTAVNVDPAGAPIQFARTRFAAERVALTVEEAAEV